MTNRLTILIIIFGLLLPKIMWATDRYVHTQSANPQYPYASWDTAAHSIEDAALGAGSSDVIVLWPEIHAISGAVQLPAGLKQKDDSEDYTQCIVEFDLEVNSGFKNNASIPLVEIRGVTFRNHRAGDGWAALELGTEAEETTIEVKIEYCRFSNNKGKMTPGGRGSAISASTRGRKMTINILNSLFDGNEAALYGGAVYAAGQYYSGGLDLNISNSTFRGNQVDDGYNEGRGGVIFASLGLGTLRLSNVTFHQNEARLRGGAINLWAGHLDIDDCIFTENKLNSDASIMGSAGIMGAAINVRNYWDDYQLSVEIDDSIFDGNYGLFGDWRDAFDGGALHFMGSNEESGAPYAMIDPITITNCIFKNNFAKQGAGTYFGRYTDNIKVRRTKYIDNISYISGGAAYKGGKYASNKGETAIFEYCSFIGNKAGYTKDLGTGSNIPQGGAVMTRLYPRIFFHNCSFLNNRVRVGQKGDSFYTTDEGLVFDISGQSQIINCCFWGTGDTHEVAARENGGESAFSVVDYNAWSLNEFNSIYPPLNVINLVENPFRSLYDAHLTFMSPCRDSGTDEWYSNEIIDMDGQIVTDPIGDSIDEGIDIGAYEYIDSDNDYMPDWWEIENDLNPLANDAFEDSDADGFSNLREYLSISNPKNSQEKPAIIADTDGDKDTDGVESMSLMEDFGRNDCFNSNSCFDLFHDGVVNEIDLFLFAEDFGRTETGFAAP